MVIWLIGLSGSGKTTLAEAVVSELKGKVNNYVYLDGDIIREVFGNDLGYTLEDRRKNAFRVSRLCKFLSSQGINVIASILSLFPDNRQWNRENIPDYFEVFIDAPLEQLVSRDSKNLYGRALRGEAKNVAGVDLEFPIPENPDLVIRNSGSLDGLLGYAPQLARRMIEL